MLPRGSKVEVHVLRFECSERMAHIPSCRARVVNVTLYSLRASLSPQVAWSTAPGGLSTGGRWTVDGHATHGGGRGTLLCTADVGYAAEDVGGGVAQRWP